MPSPKAVLRDIHDLGLNPKKPYSAIKHTGRLNPGGHAPAAVEPAPVVKEKPAPKPVEVKKAEPVAPPPEPVKKAEPKPEPVAEVKKEEKPVEKPAEKPAKKADKAEKKDEPKKDEKKPEEPPVS